MGMVLEDNEFGNDSVALSHLDIDSITSYTTRHSLLSHDPFDGKY